MPTSQQLREASKIKKHIETLQGQLVRLLGSSIPKATTKRKLTAAGRARISAAVKARWVREKAAKK